MKMRKFIYTLSAAAALALTSCGSDFLSTPTDSRVELNDSEKLRMLLVSSYPSYNYAWPCEIMSDNMEDNNAPDEEGLRYNLRPNDRGDDEMFRWDVCVSNTSSDSPSGIWESHYGAIAGANAVLEVLEKWEKEGPLSSKDKAIKGEALLIRSYCHFILAQVFCQPYRGEEANASYLGVPYIKKPETTVKPHYERGTLKETYDNIRKDLEEGLPLIDNSLYEIPKYHFNRTAAEAYAARFYLFTREYDKCLEHCNNAFGGAEVDPTMYMSTLFKNSENFYYISDFGLFAQGSDKPRNFMLIATYSQLWRRFIGQSRYAVIRDALNATIRGASPAWSSFRYTLKSGKSSKSFTMHPGFATTCGSNGAMEYGSYYIGNVSEQFEYTDKLSGIGYTHVTRSEFTGEEVLLTRAEAKLFLGDINGALADIDIWEKARRDCPSASSTDDRYVDLTIDNITKFYGEKNPGYGIAKTINIDQICPSKWSVSSKEEIAMLQCIQHFRRIETIHTGMRWFDIKRFGLEFDRKIGKDGTDHLGVFDDRKAIQIPAEIVATGMQQNPRASEEDRKVVSSSEYVAVRD